jgi:hypothetical protein
VPFLVGLALGTFGWAIRQRTYSAHLEKLLRQVRSTDAHPERACKS